jgi:hypothetical protein
MSEPRAAAGGDRLTRALLDALTEDDLRYLLSRLNALTPTETEGAAHP